MPKKCPGCGKILAHDERYCYFCEGDISKLKDKEEKPKCFIATSVYGENAYETLLLRNFRDKKLKNSFIGAIFIDIYHTISPLIAKLISKNETLKKITRLILKPIIAFARKTMH